jgi:DNA invertase Pin-like site-specific DNA recombinase
MGEAGIVTNTTDSQSGASHLRPGYQKLLEGARKGEFDIVLAEALDRSRDQEHVASFFKLMSFAGGGKSKAHWRE